MARRGPEWRHVVILEDRAKGDPRVQCIHCDKAFVAGATRIRYHLLGNNTEFPEWDVE